MPRAKSLTDEELKRLLRVLTTTRYGSRNRLIVLLGHWAGMRVGEIVTLTISDVLNDDGSVKDTINLSADQTKGSSGRTVHISKRLQMEITAYIRLLRKFMAISEMSINWISRRGGSAECAGWNFSLTFHLLSSQK
jgi:integrase/recombinase XerD